MRWSEVLSVLPATIIFGSGDGNSRPNLIETQPESTVSASRHGTITDHRMIRIIPCAFGPGQRRRPMGLTDGGSTARVLSFTIRKALPGDPDGVSPRRRSPCPFP